VWIMARVDFLFPTRIQLSSCYPHAARDQCLTKLKMTWSSARAHISLTLNFEFRISWQRGQETVNFNTGTFSEANVPSIFIIPNEFVFLIEIIKALCYYISYYFFTYFETINFVSWDFNTHSAGLTIVNKDVLPSLFFGYF